MGVKDVVQGVKDSHSRGAQRVVQGVHRLHAGKLGVPTQLGLSQDQGPFCPSGPALRGLPFGPPTRSTNTSSYRLPDQHAQDAQDAPEAPLKGEHARHDQPQRVCGPPAIH